MIERSDFMDNLIEYFYSGGDLMMCNIKLIVTFMFLQFILNIIGIIGQATKGAIE